MVLSGSLAGYVHQVLRRRMGDEVACPEGKMGYTGHDRAEVLAARFREAFCCFDRYARQAFASAFGSVAHFVAQHRMKVRVSDLVPERRSFQFVLDDCHVTISFAIEGIDQLECTSECWLPRVGRAEGVRSTTSLRDADRRWGESCLLMALHGFVLRWAESRCRRGPAVLSA